MDISTKQFEMAQIVGIIKLLKWKTKIQTFREEILFIIGKYILGKGKINFFGIVFILTFLQKVIELFLLK